MKFNYDQFLGKGDPDEGGQDPVEPIKSIDPHISSDVLEGEQVLIRPGSVQGTSGDGPIV